MDQVSARAVLVVTWAANHGTPTGQARDTVRLDGAHDDAEDLEDCARVGFDE